MAARLVLVVAGGGTSSPGLNEQWVRDQEEVARQADARSFEAASPDAQEMEQQEQVE